MVEAEQASAGGVSELIPVPARYAGFDPARPFPVFVTGPFHAGVVRELNRCADAAEVMALFARTKPRADVAPAPGASAQPNEDDFRYRLLRDRLSKVNGGLKGVGDYSYNTCRKYLKTLTALNPVVYDVWHDAGRKPENRELLAAFVAAVARNAVAVDVSETGISDLGLRLYLGTCELARAEAASEATGPARALDASSTPAPTTSATEARRAARFDQHPPKPLEYVRAADVAAASEARLFPRRSHENFNERVREDWAEAGFIEARLYTDPAANDGRTVALAVEEPASFPALVRADALLFPPAEVERFAGPFTGAVLHARRAAALALPRRLLAPAAARDAVRDAPCFRLAREHDLFGHVAIFEQRIHTRWEEAALVVHRVVENEYRGIFLLGARLDAAGSKPRMWSAPARADQLRWKRSGPAVDELPGGTREALRSLFDALDARLGVACAAVTDVPLQVTLLLRGDDADRARDARIACARTRQVQALQRAGAAASPYPPVRVGAVQAGCYEYRDVVSGRTEFLAELRARADAVVAVEARYLVRKEDAEQALAGVPYDYLWAWDGRRLMGLGGSAVSMLEAYEAWGEASGVPLAAGVARELRHAGEPDEVLDLHMEDGPSIAVPLAANVRQYRAAERRRREDYGR